MKTTLRKQLKEKPRDHAIDWSKGLSSGNALTNLALSGRPDMGFLPGHHYPLVGDSGAGKTWQVLQAMAEACCNSHYKDYRLIFDQPEHGALMDLSSYFGPALAGRIEQPSKRGASRTLEEFYDNLQTAVEAGPCIYGLDSEDALDCLAEAKLRSAAKKARDANTEAKGTFGTTRAKLNSSSLRVANNGLAASGSILFMIKQTRQTIGFGSQFNPKTKSGGLAITFYATDEVWYSVRGKIAKPVLGKNRVIGSILQVRVKKNRQSGRDRTVELDFYPSMGIDETGSLCRWLTGEGVFAADKEMKRVKAEAFNFDGSLEKLAQFIENNGREAELRDMVVERWREVEEACEPQRKPRYS